MFTPTTERVSASEYLETYADQFYEWMDGILLKMPLITDTHYKVGFYLNVALETYLQLNPIGQVRAAPFVMDVAKTNSKREPDLQVILANNLGQLTSTKMIGAADICIEIVSPESVQRDYGEKLMEYETGGVKEYWIIDPIRKVSHFYRLAEDGHYHNYTADEHGQYRTPHLPNFVLHVPTLWQAELPSPIQVVEAIKAMMQEA